MIGAIKEVLGNRWVFALFTLIVFYAVAKLMHVFLVKYLRVWASRTKTKTDDLIIEKTNRFVSMLIFFVGARIALTRLDLNARLYELLIKLTYTGVTFFVRIIMAIIIMVLLNEWAKRFASRTKSNMDMEVLPLIQKFSDVLLWIISFILILDIWGVNIGPFVASLGIAGIAIGLAVKDSLANVFGGVSLILDKNIKVGDVILLGEATDTGESGKIMDIGLRSTKILTHDNEMKIVPNGILANSIFVNYSLPDPRIRIKIQFGVEYGTDVDKVKRVVLSEIKKINGIFKEPEPAVRFLEMADSSLNFKAYFWVKDYDERAESREAAVKSIYNALKRNKINIPFPTRTVYVKRS